MAQNIFKRNCPECNKEFLGQKVKIYCCKKCASKASIQNRLLDKYFKDIGLKNATY